MQVRIDGNVLGNVSHYELTKKSSREKLTFCLYLYFFRFLRPNSPASEGISLIWYNNTFKSSQRETTQHVWVFELFQKLPAIQYQL